MVNVIDTTIKYNLCSGCGVCAGICPSQVLVMHWNASGELNPIRIKPCPHDCGLCTKVCPALTTKEMNEDTISRALYGSIQNIQHTAETGYYHTCGVGGVADSVRRAECASGGLATWFLERLLKNHVVDAVICVHHAYNKDHLFEYRVCHSISEVHDSKGSAYYPNELSEVIRYIIEHDERFAIISLPCCIKALRLAQAKNKLLRDRIIYVAGLTCSKVLDAHFTEYVAYLSGVKTDLSYVQYRNTDYVCPPKCHKYLFCDSTGNNIMVNPEISRPIFHSGIFELPCCKYCDDIFAECADITFMDAWLPEYTQTEPKGTSLYVSRTPDVSEIMETGDKTKELLIQPISIQKIISSQYGLARRKKIQYLLNIRKKRKQYIPFRRFQDKSWKLNIYERYLAKRHLSLGVYGKKKWIAVSGDYKKFEHWRQLQKLRDLPVHIGVKCIGILYRKCIRPMKK